MSGASTWDYADIARWLGEAVREHGATCISYNTSGLPTFSCSEEAAHLARRGDDSALEHEFRAHVQANVRF